MDIREVSLSERLVGLRVASASGDRIVVFSGVSTVRCKMAASSAHIDSLETVGLEKLGAGEVWRLYAQTGEGAELELSCRAIHCDGVEVTGIGRSYHH